VLANVEGNTLQRDHPAEGERHILDLEDRVRKQLVLPEPAKGAKAAEMAFRGGEIKGGATYPAAGDIRGGSKYKDWYYFSGLTVSIGLGSPKRGSMKDRGNLSCPKVN